jgi:hypothetical protein
MRRSLRPSCPQCRATTRVMDHFGINHADFAKAWAFYDEVLGVLGYSRQMDFGAESLHEPRLWPEYHTNYFGAFVRDLDGNNVEAVCHSVFQLAAPQQAHEKARRPTFSGSRRATRGSRAPSRPRRRAVPVWRRRGCRPGRRDRCASRRRSPRRECGRPASAPM